MSEKNETNVSLCYENSHPEPTPDSEEHWAGYHLFILFCCLSALGLLAAGDVGHGNPEVRTLLEWADTAVCAIFLLDFFVSLVRSKNKIHYLFTWGWIDLISAIPALDVVRWGRAARILRILRVIRGIKVGRIILSLFVHYRTRNALLAGIMVVIFSIFTASTAILVVETEPDSTIKTAEDAVWWTLCTISTVGYGDLFPVTRLGRVVASFLLLLGVGVFGALAGILANWFTGESSEKDDSEMKQLTEEIVQMRSMINELRKDGSEREPSQKKKRAA